MSSTTRVTGLSGFDVDKTVKDLMKAENAKLDKLKQKQTKTQWEQDAYREITTELSAFQSSYFDYLKPETNFRSPNTFAIFTSNVSVNGTTSTEVSVTGTGSVNNLSHKINSITQLASADTYVGAAANIASLNGKVYADDAAFLADMPATFKINLGIDSNTKSIEVDTTGVTKIEEFVTKLNSAISSKFGAGYTNVAQVDDTGSGKRLKLYMPSSNVKVISQSGSETSTAWIGISSGSQSNDYASKTLATHFSWVDDDLKTMKIGDASLYDMGIRTTDTIAQMSTKIEAAGVGATLKYNTLTDKFELKAQSEGEANNLTVSNELLTAFKFNATGSTHNAGKNAVFNLDGIDLVKSSNNFTIEGVNYTLNKTHDASAGAIDVSLKPDADKIADRIKTFINAYNGLIASVGAKLDEKVYRSYTPLTDDQRENMSEDDIKLWETKAKSGILRNQTDLESMLVNMRKAFSDPVQGAGISLAEIGITNTANYKERGKLEIDDTKLKSAITNNYSKVVSLFTSKSDKDYQDSANVTERFNESGIADRLNDVLQDMVRTTKGNSTSKGILLEKAGKIGDTTEQTSVLSKQLTDYEDRVYDMIEYLNDKENYYYEKFSKIESALAQMNAQSSSLTNMLGGN